MIKRIFSILLVALVFFAIFMTLATDVPFGEDRTGVSSRWSSIRGTI